MISVTDEARLKKQKLDQIGPEARFFVIFKFGSLVYLESAYNDCLQQCITSIRGKIPEKKVLGPKFGPKGPKLGLKVGFLLLSQVWFVSFPLNCLG